MAKIQAIEAFPDNKAHSVKPINLRDDDKIIRKSCTACKFRGIRSRSAGGSANIAASMDKWTSPISADTNLTNQTGTNKEGVC